MKKWTPFDSDLRSSRWSAATTRKFLLPGDLIIILAFSEDQLIASGLSDPYDSTLPKIMSRAKNPQTITTMVTDIIEDHQPLSRGAESAYWAKVLVASPRGEILSMDDFWFPREGAVNPNWQIESRIEWIVMCICNRLYPRMLPKSYEIILREEM